ncbi:MAG: anthrone oxygenase family protein [Candidatus Acidiferrales bacterium]
MTLYFLVATIVVFSFHLAGHIFDAISIIPNWKSGEVEDMERNKAFFREGQIRFFFGLMISSCFVVSLVTMILLLGDRGAARLFAILAFALSTATSIWTVVYFVPMNKYFEGGEYQADRLKQVVRKWITANRLRFVLLTLCLLFSILALTHYLSPLCIGARSRILSAGMHSVRLK